MIKEALQYIVGLKEPSIKEINGVYYSDKDITRVEPVTRPVPFQVNTLSSLVDYIISNKDNIELNKAILHIENYTTISLFTTLDQFNSRSEYIICKADVPTFKFDRYYNSEDFNIRLQSLFCDTADRAKILRIAGNIKTTEANTVADDGITQLIQTKKGVILGEEESVPNPVELAPYRTFTEISQPISKFIFRISNGPEMALFEADGGAWKLIVIQRIKEYLENSLENTPAKDITILA